MKVAMVCPVKHIQSIVDVASSMRVDNVQNHIEPKAVSLVHQILELVRCPIATGRGKEAGHMIPKAAVVGVLMTAISSTQV